MDKQLILFVIVSVVLFASIIVGPKTAGLGLILWFLTLAYTMSKMVFKNYSIKKFFVDIDRKTRTTFRDSKYVAGSIYAITTPLIIIGIGILLMIIIFLFSI